MSVHSVSAKTAWMVQSAPFDAKVASGARGAMPGASRHGDRADAAQSLPFDRALKQMTSIADKMSPDAAPSGFRKDDILRVAELDRLLQQYKQQYKHFSPDRSASLNDDASRRKVELVGAWVEVNRAMRVLNKRLGSDFALSLDTPPSRQNVAATKLDLLKKFVGLDWDAPSRILAIGRLDVALRKFVGAREATDRLIQELALKLPPPVPRSRI